MNLSHRLRLALASTAATGLVLATLFVATVSFARRDVLGDKRVELSAVMQSLTPPSDSRFDLAEFEDTHPELSASVFDASGRPVANAGRFPPQPGRGYAVHGNRLELGTMFKGQNVVLSLDLSESNKGVDRLTAVLAAMWLPLTLLVGGATWAAAHAVFRPLDRLSGQALAMSGANLSERLATSDRAEFGAFANRLNEMLDRIEETVQRGERFSVDAAHELRTPLAIVRTRLETALLRIRTTEEYEATLRRSVAEIERLTAIVESLLRSARGEAAPAVVIDLEPIVAEILERWAERFTAGGVRLEGEIRSVPAAILPDEVRIVLDNLLDNALRYAPASSSVKVATIESEGEAQLLVSDQGPGIPADLGERVFDRFVRGDDSRNRASGGAGIGLSVVRQIVDSRGGGIHGRETQGGGATMIVSLPRLPEAKDALAEASHRAPKER